MDEPFASVDAQTRMTLQEELTRIWQERRPTIIFITHDVSEAVFLADRVIVLADGPVLKELEVTLPRPRAWDRLIEDAAFKALSAECFNWCARHEYRTRNTAIDAGAASRSALSCATSRGRDG